MVETSLKPCWPQRQSWLGVEFHRTDRYADLICREYVAETLGDYIPAHLVYVQPRMERERSAKVPASRRADMASFCNKSSVR